MRGPIRNKGRSLDVVARGRPGRPRRDVLAAAATSSPTRASLDPWLFRGGFFLTGLATLLRDRRRHPPPRARRRACSATRCSAGSGRAATACTCTTGRSTRSSAGWPALRCRSPSSSLAMVITVVVTELSYRLIEMPIRRGQVGRWWRRAASAARDPAPRRVIAGAGAGGRGLLGVRRRHLATAQLKPNEIAQSLDERRRLGHQHRDRLVTTTTTGGPTTTGTTVPAPVDRPDHRRGRRRRRRCRSHRRRLPRRRALATVRPTTPPRHRRPPDLRHRRLGDAGRRRAS